MGADDSAGWQKVQRCVVHWRIQITPFFSAADYERMLDYFLEAEELFLRAMGVDPKRPPQRAAWLAKLLPDLTPRLAERQRASAALI